MIGVGTTGMFSTTMPVPASDAAVRTMTTVATPAIRWSHDVLPGERVSSAMIGTPESSSIAFRMWGEAARMSGPPTTV